MFPAISTMNYPQVRNILGAAFSIETGLDAGAAKALYERALAREPELRMEVKAALNDSTVDWIELLNNENGEVYEADSQEDAYRYASRILASTLLE